MNSNLSVCIIGERHNFITNQILINLIGHPRVNVKLFIEAEIPEIKFNALYNDGIIPSRSVAALARKAVGKAIAAIWRKKKNPSSNTSEEPDNYDICMHNGIKIVCPENKNINNGIPEEILKIDLDYIFIAGCDQIVKENIIRWPKKKVINYHYSLLPSYRGKFVLFWQWYYEEPFIGYTFHEVDLGIDTGKPILQGTVKYFPEEKLEDVWERVVKESAQEIKCLIDLLENRETRLLQALRPESYFAAPQYHDLRYIKLTDTREEVAKRIRKLPYVNISKELSITRSKIVSGNQKKSVEIKGLHLLIRLNGFRLAVYEINNKPALFFYFEVRRCWK